MKLTPLDIRHKEFRRAMRGYSDEEVDVFLDEIADEFERLFQENIDAQERIQRLQEQVAQYDGLKDTLQKTLITAQQQADEMKSNSRKEGELIVRDAELRARDILSESYTDKQRVQQSLISLRQVEEDFRFKFKSLLEAHLNLLSEDESSDERRRFRGLVDGVEQDSGPAMGAQPSDAAVESPGAVDGGEAASPLSPPDAPPVSDEVAEGVVAGTIAAEEADSVWVFAAEPADVPPAFLTRSEDGAATSSPDPESDDDATDTGSEAVESDEGRSSARRFLFGKKEKETDEDFFSEKKDRDFEW
jgi:cell division initiation protein